ncbi:MAG TPA: AAA family ATPase [Thermoanaerobaculia bacterium]|nr:AAA family ATPase [Thermoanaerobaculia bacterium]
MIQSFSIENFKSFRKATLPLAPLTLLIGANASGKSNAIEAIQLLSWLASGRRLDNVLTALREQELNLRGTPSDFTYQGAFIDLGCQLASVQTGPYRLSLTFSVRLKVGEDGLGILSESLESPDLATHFPLYKVVGPASRYSHEIQVAYNNFAQGGKKPHIACIDQQAIFTQLSTPARFSAYHKASQSQIPAAATRLRQSLESILFLDPNPRRMRGYSYIQEKKLQGDGAALSSVLYRLIQEEKQKEVLLDFIRSLPEQDIQDISFLEAPRDDVMVQLHENFGDKVIPREAALLSDGTLRVLAVAAAVLSVPKGSLVIIEEIDNGVHPSRANLLLKNIQRIAHDRQIRVLITTHNPALLDAIPPEAVPATVACYRDPKEGDSRLIRLEDLASYPELVAQGPLGRLVTRGILDRFLKDPEKRDSAAKVEKGLAWISDFKRRAQSS